MLRDIFFYFFIKIDKIKRSRIFFFIYFVVSITYFFFTTPESGIAQKSFWRVHKNEDRVVGYTTRYGLIDEKGNIVLPAEYQELIPTSTNAYVVGKSGAYGLFFPPSPPKKKSPAPVRYYYNRYYRRMMPIAQPIQKEEKKDTAEKKSNIPTLIYQSIREYVTYDGTSNRYIVQKDHKYSILDEDGTELLPFEIDSLSDFMLLGPNKMAVALAMKQHKWGYISIDGNWVIPPVYHFLSTYEPEGIIAHKDTAWGVIDLYQKPLLPFNFDSLYWGGRIDKQLYLCAGVLNKTSPGLKWGVFRATNFANPILPLAYNSIQSILSSEAFEVEVNGIKSVVFNGNLEFNASLIPVDCPYRWKYTANTTFYPIIKRSKSKEFNEKKSDFNKRAIDQEKTILTVYADQKSLFSIHKNGILFNTKNAGKFGVINSDKSILFPPEYDRIIHFENDYLGNYTFQSAQKSYFILKKDSYKAVANDKGQIIHPFKYTEIEIFSENHAVGYLPNEDIVLLFPDGRTLFFSDCEAIEPLFFQNKLVVIGVKKNNRWGIADTGGNIKSEFDWERIVKLQGTLNPETGQYDFYLLAACSSPGNGNLTVEICQITPENSIKQITDCVFQLDINTEEDLEVLNSLNPFKDSFLIRSTGLIVGEGVSFPGTGTIIQKEFLSWNGNRIIQPEYDDIVFLSDSLLMLIKNTLDFYGNPQKMVRIAGIDGSLKKYDYVPFSLIEKANKYLFQPNNEIENSQTASSNGVLWIPSDSRGTSWKGIKLSDGRPIDKITTAQYDKVLSLPHRSTLVQKSGKWGLIDPQGNDVIYCEYDTIIDFFEWRNIKFYKVKYTPRGNITNSGWGIYSELGKEIFPPIFHNIEYSKVKEIIFLQRRLSEKNSTTNRLKYFEQFAYPDGSTIIDNTPSYNSLYLINENFFVEIEADKNGKEGYKCFISTPYSRKEYEFTAIHSLPNELKNKGYCFVDENHPFAEWIFPISDQHIWVRSGCSWQIINLSTGIENELFSGIRKINNRKWEVYSAGNDNFSSESKPELKYFIEKRSIEKDSITFIIYEMMSFASSEDIENDPKVKSLPRSTELRSSWRDLANMNGDTTISADRFDSSIHCIFNHKGREIARNMQLHQVLNSNRAIIRIPLQLEFEENKELFGVIDSSGKTIVPPIYNLLEWYQGVYYAEQSTNDVIKKYILSENGTPLINSINENLEVDIDKRIIYKGPLEVNTIRLPYYKITQATKYDFNGNYLGVLSPFPPFDLNTEANIASENLNITTNRKIKKKKVYYKIQKRKNLWGAIGLYNREIIPFNYDSVWNDPDFPTIIQAKKDTLHFLFSVDGGLIYKSKNIIIVNDEFYDDFKILILTDGNDIARRQYIIHKDGLKTAEIILEPQWEPPMILRLQGNKDLLEIRTLKNISGVWHKIYKLILPIKYDEIGEIISEFIPFKTMGRWGLANTRGQEIISPRFEQLITLNPSSEKRNFTGSSFVYHLVKSENKFGLFLSGRQIIPCEYDELQTLGSDEWVAARKKGKNSYLIISLKNGNVTGSTEGYESFQHVEGKKNELLVMRNGFWGALNLYGEIIKPAYSRLLIADNNTWRACKKGKWFLIDEKGNNLSTETWDYLEK